MLLTEYLVVCLLLDKNSLHVRSGACLAAYMRCDTCTLAEGVYLSGDFGAYIL